MPGKRYNAEEIIHKLREAVRVCIVLYREY